MKNKIHIIKSTNSGATASAAAPGKTGNKPLLYDIALAVGKTGVGFIRINMHCP